MGINGHALGRLTLQMFLDRPPRGVADDQQCSLGSQEERDHESRFLPRAAKAFQLPGALPERPLKQAPIFRTHVRRSPIRPPEEPG
jgi:hypothetical protein